MSTSRARMSAVGLAGLLIWTQACGSAPDSTSAVEGLLPAEPPDLADMGEGVQDQYQQLRSALIDLLASPAAVQSDLASAWGRLGMWHQTYDYPDTGLYCYREAIRLDPSDGRWPYYSAQILQLDGEFERARDSYLRLLELEPGRPGPVLRLAELELEMRRPEAAEHLYRQILATRPDSAPARFGLGRIAFQNGEAADAIEHFEAALEQHPEASRIHYHLAIAYRETGDLARAQKHLDRVPETNRNQLPLPLGEPWDRELNLMDRGPGAFRQRAMQARRLEREGLATELFGRAVAADPRNVEMKLAYARSLDRIGQTPAAIELLETALTAHPAHAGLKVLLGTIVARTGDRRRAGELLRESVAADPECLRCRRALGVLLSSLGKHDEALEHLEFLRFNHVSDITSFSYAVTLLRLGRQREAIAALEQDRRMLPEAEALRLLLCRLLAAATDSDLRDVERAQELLAPVRGTHVTAAETVAMVEAAAGRFDRAAAWQRRTVEAVDGQSKQIRHRSRRRLELYASGRPCLAPWEPGERLIAVPVTPP